MDIEQDTLEERSVREGALCVIATRVKEKSKKGQGHNSRTGGGGGSLLLYRLASSMRIWSKMPQLAVLHSRPILTPPRSPHACH